MISDFVDQCNTKKSAETLITAWKKKQKNILYQALNETAKSSLKES